MGKLSNVDECSIEIIGVYDGNTGNDDFILSRIYLSDDKIDCLIRIEDINTGEKEYIYNCHGNRYRSPVITAALENAFAEVEKVCLVPKYRAVMRSSNPSGRITFEWPIKLDTCTDLMYSHNSLIRLWFWNKNIEMQMLWQGVAWSLPDEYHDLLVERIVDIVPEKLDDAGYINLLTNATDDTPSNLPGKKHDITGCSDSPHN